MENITESSDFKVLKDKYAVLVLEQEGTSRLRNSWLGSPCRLGTPDTLEARESAESTEAWGRSRT